MNGDWYRCCAKKAQISVGCICLCFTCGCGFSGASFFRLLDVLVGLCNLVGPVDAATKWLSLFIVPNSPNVLHPTGNYLRSFRWSHVMNFIFAAERRESYWSGCFKVAIVRFLSRFSPFWGC